MKVNGKRYQTLEEEIDHYIDMFKDNEVMLDRFERLLTSQLTLNDGENVCYTDAEIAHSLKYFHRKRLQY